MRCCADTGSDCITKTAVTEAFTGTTHIIFLLELQNKQMQLQESGLSSPLLLSHSPSSKNSQ